jgi:tetratricopeptide (TPR) repeat protein
MSDSYAAYNNLGAVYMNMAMNASNDQRASFVEKAITNFDLSLKKQKSTEAYANLASAQLLKGDKAAAMATLGNISGSASGDLGATISALRGYVSITTGEYDKAIGELERGGNQAVVLYDKALALLLKASKESKTDDYPKAMAAFQEAIGADSKLALAYYGAAITASRMADNDKLVSNLKKAIELDKSLKERAVKDLEFFGKETVVAEATR